MILNGMIYCLCCLEREYEFDEWSGLFEIPTKEELEQ